MATGPMSFEIPPAALLDFKARLLKAANGIGIDSTTALRGVMRGVVINLVSWTPPRGKPAGEATVKRDVPRAVGVRAHYIIRAMLKSNKAFAPRPARSVADVKSEHNAVRNNRGVVPPSQTAHIVATQGMVNTEIERSIRRVGRLKAGWNAAAVAFKVRLPSYVWRHGTTMGSATDDLRKNMKGYVEATNSVPYIGRQSGIAYRALRLASRKSIEALEKAVGKNAAKFNAK
jgi:hypothetical protein